MPSYDRKTAFKIGGGGPKLGYTQKSYFVEISDYNDLYTVLIFTFVWFLSYFLSHQISPKTLKDFSPLNVIGIKFSIVIYLVLKAYDYCPLIYPFVISSYAMHHMSSLIPVIIPGD